MPVVVLALGSAGLAANVHANARAVCPASQAGPDGRALSCAGRDGRGRQPVATSAPTGLDPSTIKSVYSFPTSSAAARAIRGKMPGGRSRSRSTSSGRTRSRPARRSCSSRPRRTASRISSRPRTTPRRARSTCRRAAAAAAPRTRPRMRRRRRSRTASATKVRAGGSRSGGQARRPRCGGSFGRRGRGRGRVVGLRRLDRVPRHHRRQQRRAVPGRLRPVHRARPLARLSACGGGAVPAALPPPH